MKRWLYDFCLVGLFLLLSPWIVYRAVRHGKWCPDWRQRFFGCVPTRSNQQDCVWFHAVSVGEVNLLQPVIQQLIGSRPEIEIVISTTTQTGHALAVQRFPHYPVFFAPIDFSWAVRRVYRRIRPTMLVLCELELWPNLIGEAHRSQVPVAVINGRLSEKSFANYRRFRLVVQRMFARLDLVAAQTDEYAERFSYLGVRPEALFTSGSIKFDGVNISRSKQQASEFRELAGYTSDEMVFLAGSTELGEEQIACAAYVELVRDYPQLRLILVPRHIERAMQVVQTVEQFGLSAQLRTGLDHDKQLTSGAVLVVDTIGELAGWWGVADIGFVGGSFGKRGGQNMLEPAACAVATCFGPNTKNFRQIVRILLDAEAVVQLQAPADLAKFIRQCLTDQQFANRLRDNAQLTIARHAGATKTTLLKIEKLLDVAAVKRGNLLSKNAA
ncbi:MAG TPA: 3-deoxy-D-manno-octulosonic acid transferase [Pirellulaceae bacterium]|nr:3-deoxy-D-manno-octulosonic acid transferase [Pirellulaceae bacterium]HMO93323.1 3-deoxy-D-manno-octulosonic acid transferase [Pirellulaceae bacterium]HMP69138.1 3-deoxy-D-manno-octulosonic acid transferase [Pirellulaceae bacterium]